MSKIMLLDQSTINKIAAGEVVERPVAVVKELVENSIDAGANAITVEIKDGGTNLIRITDNGSGIKKEQISIAFKRHATSKIQTVEDLMMVSSLGFRGEALASIAAVSQVEVITKTMEELTGIRYEIDGGEEKNIEEIGCPEGTTLLIKNLFYNTPARKKFLKSNASEAGVVVSLIEKFCVSHPFISFKFIKDGQLKIHSSGNGNMKDILYQIYGKEIARELVEIEKEVGVVSMTGFIANPVVSRANRNYMNYFVNGRYVKSSVIHKAIEEAYRPYSMVHRYPFTSIQMEIAPEWIDVNVHPAKMEVRFHDSQVIYNVVYESLSEALGKKELIPEVDFESKKTKKDEKLMNIKKNIPEPFEKNRREYYNGLSGYKPQTVKEQYGGITHFIQPADSKKSDQSIFKEKSISLKQKEKPVQQELFEHTLLSKENIKKHRLVGQIFKTYWIIEMEDKMYMVDQHAAHEKIIYERTMKKIESKQGLSQMVNPPVILSLSMEEQQILEKYEMKFKEIGFEMEPFGGKEYALHAVPADLLGLQEKEVFLEMLDALMDEKKDCPVTMILEKAASMSCKAAVKGNQELSFIEAEALIDDLMTLENPYHCPHGRPVLISMSKYEIEKKFKRIV